MDSFSEDRPTPIIDLALCDGCGLCVRACPSHALALEQGKAIVARPDACQYDGYCELICPVQAINRPFLIKWSSESSLTTTTDCFAPNSLISKG
jgi:NAD-dependent dihydropyrimidine dehydrogenase PreA subunit